MWIELSAYQSTWPQQFVSEAARLRQALSQLPDLQIEHVGSTSVPGLCAKPIIDILLGVADEDELTRLIEPICDLGYCYVQRHEAVMPFRRFFFNLKDAQQALPRVDHGQLQRMSTVPQERFAHLHAVVVGTPFWQEHLLFRDHLRQSPEAKQRYAELKQQLVQQQWSDGNAYADAKGPLIQQLLAQARLEKACQAGTALP